MDELLKEFNKLALPSRVNFDSIDNFLKQLDLNSIFEALKEKGQEGTSFQWRKLRESCLINRNQNKNFNLIISIYEESIKFNIKKNEFTEAHISISNLINIIWKERHDSHEDSNYLKDELIGIIILFKFYYSSIEGLNEFLETSHSRCELENHYIVDICIAAINGNILNLIKFKASEGNEIIQLLIDKIIEQLLVNNFVTSIIRSYPIIRPDWLCTLMNEPSQYSSDIPYLKDKLIKKYGIPSERVNLNPDSTKFIFRIKKIN